MESYKKFPSDEEFRSQFPVISIYNLRVVSYVLGKLENSQHGKEPISVENLYDRAYNATKNTTISTLDQ